MAENGENGGNGGGGGLLAEALDDDGLTVAEGTVVRFHYRMGNDKGELWDESEEEGFEAWIGLGDVVPGLEAELIGKSAGDVFDCVVLAEDGYGKHDAKLPTAHPRKQFPKELPLEPGMVIGVQNKQGKQVAVWVTKVTDKFVYLDHNHPLAGKTLHFHVEIADVRKPSEEELAARMQEEAGVMPPPEQG